MPLVEGVGALYLFFIMKYAGRFTLQWRRALPLVKKSRGILQYDWPSLQYDWPSLQYDWPSLQYDWPRVRLFCRTLNPNPKSSRIHQWRTLHMDEKITWLPMWQHLFEEEFCGGQVSWATSKPQRNLTYGEL
jgi:hypothetical protein